MDHEKLILFAEDNVVDQLRITRIFTRSALSTQLRFVEDGKDLINYLCKRGSYTSGNAPTPDLIVFDINMFEKNGYEALDKIKSNTELKQKTIVLFNKRPSHNDIEKSYDLDIMLSWSKSWSKDGDKYIEFFSNILSLT